MYDGPIWKKLDISEDQTLRMCWGKFSLDSDWLEVRKKNFISEEWKKKKSLGTIHTDKTRASDMLSFILHGGKYSVRTLAWVLIDEIIDLIIDEIIVPESRVI